MICGNRANRAARYKVGSVWMTAVHCGRRPEHGPKCDESDRCPCRCAGCLGAERAGCMNQAEPTDEHIPGMRPLGLCVACRAEQKAARRVEREHTAHLGREDHVPGLCWHGQRPGFNCGACVR